MWLLLSPLPPLSLINSSDIAFDLFGPWLRHLSNVKVELDELKVPVAQALLMITVAVVVSIC